MHAEIRKNPEHVKRAVKKDPKRLHKKHVNKKLTNKQRKDNIRKKI